jgi:hypothetical protein
MSAPSLADLEARANCAYDELRARVSLNPVAVRLFDAWQKATADVVLARWEANQNAQASRGNESEQEAPCHKHA